jgi:drug/metabolite transporter (DMT)-like permease
MSAPPTSSEALTSHPRVLGFDPFLVGSVLGISSAVCYTITNIFLRRAGISNELGWACWVTCIKAVPVTLVAWTLLANRLRRGQNVSASRTMIVRLLAAAFFVQVGGNVAFQWCLGVVGLALAVTLCLGTLIVSGALLGRSLLGEGISPRSAIAILLLIGAITLLSFGATEARTHLIPEVSGQGLTWATLGVGAAILAGVMYAILGVTIRHAAVQQVPLATSFTIIGTMGFLVLGGISLAMLGPRRMLETPPDVFADMLLAGCFNAMAFFSLGKSLQWLTVNYINVLNASQTAMAAVAGAMLFDEQLTSPIKLGILLTVAGMFLVENGRKVPRLVAKT